MSDVDDQIARARAAMERIAGEADAPAPPRRARRNQPLGKRLKRIVIADAVILVLAALFVSLVVPLGIMGALAVMALLIAATVVFIESSALSLKVSIASIVS